MVRSAIYSLIMKQIPRIQDLILFDTKLMKTFKIFCKGPQLPDIKQMSAFYDFESPLKSFLLIFFVKLDDVSMTLFCRIFGDRNTLTC